MLELLVESLTKYYGLDWIAVLFGVSATYALGQKNKIGFALSAISCVNGVVVALMSDQYGYVVYNFILMTMALHAYSNWSRVKS